MNYYSEEEITRAFKEYNSATDPRGLIERMTPMDIRKFRIRDEIAISVLPEIVKQQGQLQFQYGGCKNILTDNCHLAYKIADAMIEAR